MSNEHTEETSPDDESAPDMEFMEISDSEDDLEPSASFCEHGMSAPQISVFLHDHAGAVDVTSLKLTLGVAEVQTDALSQTDMGIQTDNCEKHSVEIQTDDCYFQPFRYEKNSDNNEIVRLYTGVPKASVFKALFEELPLGDMETSNSYKLRAIDEFSMTHMFRKLGHRGPRCNTGTDWVFVPELRTN